MKKLKKNFAKIFFFFYRSPVILHNTFAPSAMSPALKQNVYENFIFTAAAHASGYVPVLYFVRAAG